MMLTRAAPVDASNATPLPMCWNQMDFCAPVPICVIYVKDVTDGALSRIIHSLSGDLFGGDHGHGNRVRRCHWCIIGYGNENRGMQPLRPRGDLHPGGFP